MARINIEEEFWTDPRLEHLSEKIGKANAVYQCVKLWHLAQKYHKRDELITEEAFKFASLSEDLINSGFALRKESGIYACGSQEHFEWLRKMTQGGSLGGKRSGESRRNKNKHLTEGVTKPLEASRSPSNPLTLTPSLSLLNSYELRQTTTSVDNANAVVHKTKDSLEVVKSPVAYFIGAYVKAFQSRYGATSRPDLTGRIQGEIKRLINEMPLQVCCDLIQVYLQMDDAWFKTKCHDFTTFRANIGKIQIAMANGTEKNTKSDYSFLED